MNAHKHTHTNTNTIYTHLVFTNIQHCACLSIFTRFAPRGGCVPNLCVRGRVRLHACMGVCMCTFMRVYFYACVRLCVCVCVCAFMRVSMCVFLHVCVRTCVCMHLSSSDYWPLTTDGLRCVVRTHSSPTHAPFTFVSSTAYNQIS